MTDPQLAAALKDAALLEGNFTLRSGRTSHYYLDKYRFATRPELLRELAARFAQHIDDGVDLLAGPELGGVPLVTATALHTGKPFLLIRNAKKDYGTAKRFEGADPAGKRVLITEDIATSGGQSIEAARLLRDECGAEVAKVVVVVDREEGARAAIEAAGFPFAALFTKTELDLPV